MAINLFKNKNKYKIDKIYDNQMTRKLEEGDIIVYRGPKDILGSLIMEFTRSPYQHAETYIGEGWTVSSEDYGVTLSDAMQSSFIDVFRIKGGLSDLQKKKILVSAFRSLSKSYAYAALILFPFINKKKALRKSADEAFICSEQVAFNYKEAGIDLVEGRPEAIESPADLVHSDKIEFVGSWKNGVKVEDAKPSKRHPSQKDNHKFAKWIIKRIADPLSEWDEHYKELKTKSRI